MEATARINGIDLFYAVHGDGPPLVLLHGGFGIGADFELVFDFATLGGEYRLIVPDLRGHGRSTNPSGVLRVADCARDVLALLDVVGVRRCKVIALSLGAKTMLHVATLAPERIEAMVLVAATPYFPEQARRIMAAVADDNHSEAEWAEARRRHRHGDEQIRALWRMPRQLAADPADLAFTPPRLAAITARTLVVNGDRDPLYPVELAVELYRAIPDAALWIVPESGHGPIFGRLRERFAATALAFLRGEPAGD
jgi:pimeloyl-ACP methyl ester carboxylesterase